MNPILLLLVVLVILALGGLPNFGFHRFGYAPSGVLGTIVVIVLVLALMGQISL